MNDKNNPFEIIDEDKIGGAIEKVNKKMGEVAAGTRATMRWIVNILAVVAIILLSLFDADFQLQELWKSITINAMLLSLINYLVYLNSQDMGDQQGRKTDDFNNAIKIYNGIKAHITEKGIKYRLSDWCTEWSKDELENARKQLFADCHITYEDYINKGYIQHGLVWLWKQKVPVRTIRVILAANRMKPMEMSPSMLIDNVSKIRRPRRALGTPPQKKKIGGDFIKLLFVVFSMVFSCSIMFNMYSKITWASVTGAMLTLLLLFYNIISGYMKGYNRVTIDMVADNKDKTQHLEEFEKWCENK